MLRIAVMTAKSTARAASKRSAAAAATSAEPSASSSSSAPPRRSARLFSLAASTNVPTSPAPVDDSSSSSEPTLKKKKTRTAPPKAPAPGSTSVSSPGAVDFKHGTLSRRYEEGKLATGKYKVVVGTDEAGRGPLAGPVVAAACYVPLHVTIAGIHDSKKLNESQREYLYEQLTSHPEVKYAVHINSAQRIDEINILQASLEAMANAVVALDVRADFVFVDGNRMPTQLAVDAETVVQGDSKVYSIAAASVIAKVTRDRLMVALDAQYPQYNLKQHKGYPTREHMAAIAKHGACAAIHRMTFAPLKPQKDARKPKATK